VIRKTPFRSQKCFTFQKKCASASAKCENDTTWFLKTVVVVRRPTVVRRVGVGVVDLSDDSEDTKKNAQFEGENNANAAHVMSQLGRIVCALRLPLKQFSIDDAHFGEKLLF
jgi:hypothetical protein